MHPPTMHSHSSHRLFAAGTCRQIVNAYKCTRPESRGCDCRIAGKVKLERSARKVSRLLIVPTAGWSIFEPQRKIPGTSTCELSYECVSQKYGFRHSSASNGVLPAFSAAPAPWDVLARCVAIFRGKPCPFESVVALKLAKHETSGRPIFLNMEFVQNILVHRREMEICVVPISDSVRRQENCEERAEGTR